MKKIIINILLELISWSLYFFLGFAFGQFYEKYPATAVKTFGQMIEMLSPNELFWRGVDGYLLGFVLAFFVITLLTVVIEVFISQGKGTA